MKPICLICSIATMLIIPLQGKGIVGSWAMEGSVNDPVDTVITFLRNGVYVIAEEGDPSFSPRGRNGMERGTYRWNPTTKAFSVQTLVDTNGRWGFSHGSFKSATIKDDRLTIVEEKRNFTLNRISGSSPLVGGWFTAEGTGYAVISFLPDGGYLMAQDGDSSNGGRTGMERGTYSWNSLTKELIREVITDTNGAWGLSNNPKYSCTVTKNQLAINDGRQTMTLARVIAPRRPLIGLEQPVGTFLKDGKTRRNFGKAAIGTTKSKVFTILNNGNADLTNLTISKSGRDNNNFKVAPLRTKTLKPGYSTKFKVTFKPTAAGTRNAAIAISSNDTKSGPFDIKLTGVGE
jgi:hypothetical protein